MPIGSVELTKSVVGATRARGNNGETTVEAPIILEELDLYGKQVEPIEKKPRVATPSSAVSVSPNWITPDLISALRELSGGNGDYLTAIKVSVLGVDPGSIEKKDAFQKQYQQFLSRDDVLFAINRHIENIVRGNLENNKNASNQFKKALLKSKDNLRINEDGNIHLDVPDNSLLPHPAAQGSLRASSLILRVQQNNGQTTVVAELSLEDSRYANLETLRKSMPIINGRITLPESTPPELLRKMVKLSAAVDSTNKQIQPATQAVTKSVTEISVLVRQLEAEAKKPDRDQSLRDGLLEQIEEKANDTLRQTQGVAALTKQCQEDHQRVYAMNQVLSKHANAKDEQKAAGATIYNNTDVIYKESFGAYRHAMDNHKISELYVYYSRIIAQGSTTINPKILERIKAIEDELGKKADKSEVDAKIKDLLSKLQPFVDEAKTAADAAKKSAAAANTAATEAGEAALKAEEVKQEIIKLLEGLPKGKELDQFKKDILEVKDAISKLKDLDKIKAEIEALLKTMKESFPDGFDPKKFKDELDKAAKVLEEAIKKADEQIKVATDAATKATDAATKATAQATSATNAAKAAAGSATDAADSEAKAAKAAVDAGKSANDSNKSAVRSEDAAKLADAAAKRAEEAAKKLPPDLAKFLDEFAAMKRELNEVKDKNAQQAKENAEQAKQIAQLEATTATHTKDIAQIKIDQKTVDATLKKIQDQIKDLKPGNLEDLKPLIRELSKAILFSDSMLNNRISTVEKSMGMRAMAKSYDKIYTVYDTLITKFNELSTMMTENPENSNQINQQIGDIRTDIGRAQQVNLAQEFSRDPNKAPLEKANSSVIIDLLKGQQENVELINTALSGVLTEMKSNWQAKLQAKSQE